MSVEIEIVDGKVEQRGGTVRNGDRAGQQWSIRSQEAYVYNGHAHPERFTVTLSDDNAGYAPGRYTLAPESFVIGEFRTLQLSKGMKLLPIKAK